MVYSSSTAWYVPVLIVTTQSKELQVMFGHVKKVFVNKGGKSGNVWLQASSGMWVLYNKNDC